MAKAKKKTDGKTLEVSQRIVEKPIRFMTTPHLTQYEIVLRIKI